MRVFEGHKLVWSALGNACKHQALEASWCLWSTRGHCNFRSSSHPSSCLRGSFWDSTQFHRFLELVWAHKLCYLTNPKAVSRDWNTVRPSPIRQVKFLRCWLVLFWCWSNSLPALSQLVSSNRGGPRSALQYSANGTSCPRRCPVPLLCGREQILGSHSGSGPVPDSGCLSSTTFTSTFKTRTNAHFISGVSILSRVSRSFSW